MTFFSLPLIFLLLYLFEITHYGTKENCGVRKSFYNPPEKVVQKSHFSPETT